MARRTSVVIVGAGMAGLAAAVELMKVKVFDIIILEATNRAGGRIHTSELGSEVVELGANWIHGEDNNPIHKLAKENGLLKESRESSSSCSRISKDNSSTNCSTDWTKTAADKGIFILENGTVVPPEIVKKGCMWYDNQCESSTDSGNHNGCSNVSEYIKKSLETNMAEEGITDERVKHLHRRLSKWCLMQECLDMACESCKDISLAHFNDFKPCQGEYYTCLGEKGFQGIVDVFLNQLPGDAIRYCQPVDQILWTHKPSAGTTANGKPRAVVRVKGQPDILADHVIITSSVGYLKENHLSMFQPALPADKQRAINTLGFGTVDKIFLRYEKPFWEDGLEGFQLLWEHDPWHADPLKDEGEIINSESNWTWKIPGFYSVEGHDDVLCAWISGKEAEYMETLSDAEVMQTCTDILQKFLQKDVPSPVQIVVSRWGTHPYIRGSYCGYLPVHGTGDEYDVMSNPIMQECQGDLQHPLLLFAGEACHKDFQSTVHGAMVSGQQQAEKLIQFHRSPSLE
ncbi:peroxisomal N(1)-acetyl-spermine/spermidine oxidase-like [Asterias amurensis]|uniref:peroxisomal N(1)-acetyl-spermine/spermidine oxidase-like n=1 Tax=Asterias amurensis TaxID=7602 RepID=UPI003AB358CA